MPRERTGHSKHSLPTTQEKALTWASPDGQHQNQLIILFATKDGGALYSQQKQDQELTVPQIMNSLLPKSDLN